jgi:hypothetical protein
MSPFQNAHSIHPQITGVSPLIAFGYQESSFTPFLEKTILVPPNGCQSAKMAVIIACMPAKLHKSI